MLYVSENFICIPPSFPLSTQETVTMANKLLGAIDEWAHGRADKVTVYLGSFEAWKQTCWIKSHKTICCYQQSECCPNISNNQKLSVCVIQYIFTTGEDTACLWQCVFTILILLLISCRQMIAELRPHLWMWSCTLVLSPASGCSSVTSHGGRAFPTFSALYVTWAFASASKKRKEKDQDHQSKNEQCLIRSMSIHTDLYRICWW